MPQQCPLCGEETGAERREQRSVLRAGTVRCAAVRLTGEVDRLPQPVGGLLAAAMADGVGGRGGAAQQGMIQLLTV